MGKKNESEGNSRNDMPAEVDLLGMDQKCKGIKNFICTCRTPMTIAIQGDWGIGKTSAMKLIESELRANDDKGDDPKYPCIWFNTWQFSVLNNSRELFKEFVLYLSKELNEMAVDSKDCNVKNIRKDISEIMKKGVSALEKAAVFNENVSMVSNIIHGVCNFFEEKDKENKIYSETLWLKNICKIDLQYKCNT